MSHPSSQLPYHLLAIAVVVVWGVTFVSTKILLAHGLTPAAIFAIRFAIAYAAVAVFAPRRLRCDTWRDELLMAALGLSGGSLYFLTENMSLAFTTATNTSLIVCSCPLFATLLFCLLFHERLTPRQAVGAALAFVGMTVVVLNGRFVLHLSPLGDLLAFAACLCWAVYSVFMKLLSTHYSSSFINRKIFFYGLLTILPWFAVHPDEVPALGALVEPVVLGNLLFLSIVASLVCYCLWTVCIRRIGVIEVTNYVYLNPIATVIAAAAILGEAVTPWFLLGFVLILTGLYLHNRTA
ncbi:MAG: DMT family transporter [Bacteroidaceae bacterium]|nr:DMT family transporter [Bacteroidaceae bacterium]